MNFLEKLDNLMHENKLNKNSFSAASGIPYTTIDSFYKKGYENAKLSTIQKIASFFGCTVDYLVLDRVTSQHGTNSNPEGVFDMGDFLGGGTLPSREGLRIGHLYDMADDHDQQTVEHVLSRYDEDKKGIPGANNGEKTG